MRGLKIIPIFLVLLLCVYVGILFVEANRESVIVSFGTYQSKPAALGLVVLTSIFFGMILAGAICSFELVLLFLKNRRLRRELSHYSTSAHSTSVPTESTSSYRANPPEESASDLGTDPGTGERFTPL